MGTLFVVGTPIGNLGDLTARGAELLRTAQAVIAEDTRVTKKLLMHVGSTVPLISFHEYSDPRTLQPILRRLDAGETLALVTDAGTPAISDPGAYLIQEILRQQPETVILPIPGPSAVTAALSVSGFRAEPFTFFGFPPQKKGRQTFFAQLHAREEALVFFEAPHRIEKTMDALVVAFGSERRTFVAREITKLHETHYRGTLAEVTEKVKKDSIRGEYVIIIATR
ncbi:16S rRNA (cytidine(1402)-2'-O)-methyltransferase [Patescibacteria group bacterium]|nr:16S rRNA (cytidine(1402)-2'-O)-methyltransferase [Patescibacteria group bacterium]